MSRLPLFDPPPPVESVDLDGAARAFAVDPRNNVVLEASAGTGKTTVLVQRYVNLLKAGVEPSNILAITFTRKAATEMRERIVAELRKAAALSELDRQRWQGLRDRLGDIAISTIDAFCLSLLREFPLEADLDPGFDMADETEVPRFIEATLDRSMRVFNAIAKDDPDMALVIAQLGAARTRAGLALLLERRLVAWEALDRFLASGPRDLHAHDVCQRAARELMEVLQHAPCGLTGFLQDGPAKHPRFQLFVREVDRLRRGPEGLSDAQVRATLDRIALHFLTQDGSARRGGSIPPYNASHYPGDLAAKRHRSVVFEMAPHVERVVRRFARDLNVILARGIRRMFGIALRHYRETLDERAALDFADVLERALGLLRRMDEFSQSRYRLESRYHHVLVDEFQDTSRAQWELVSLLVQSWGEGMGLASNPSIFIVGDRKQSIYRFRDAEVAVLQEAGRYIEGLRSDSGARRAISRSFRAVPELLEFVNELCSEIASSGSRSHEFTYVDTDRFPGVPPQDHVRGPVLGISAADSPEACAEAVACEIECLLGQAVVRDKKSGVARTAKPGDIAILFRSRTSHREFEQALERRRIPTYVYKGLGFFDSDEIKDACALIRYLAEPTSDLRAAAFLRSGFARVSDAALATLAPALAAAVLDGVPKQVVLDEEDSTVLAHLHAHLPAWLAQVDRVPPADLFEEMFPALAYGYEIRGARRQQAWENLKKMRRLIRRIQNRGYATLARIADHIDALSAGDESNAVLEAVDAVNLMTVHASKGLEFPVVFVVNLARGATGFPKPVKVIVDAGEQPSVSVAPFVSELDELEREREQHETRRLLYVAITRARDRLYLSSVLKDGALKAGPGSLAEVLPSSLKPMFVAAATTSDDTVQWTTTSGRQFTWRVCRPPDESIAGTTARSGADGANPATGAGATLCRDERSGALAGLSTGAAGRVEVTAKGVTPGVHRTREIPHRMTVTEWLGETDPQPAGASASAADRALAGLLVHRLFQAAARQRGAAFDVRAVAWALIRAEERAVTEHADRVVETACGLWERMHARDDVRALMSEEVLAEVPFSMRVERDGHPVVLRGTIDCLATGIDGSITVVEFKTGTPREVHERQLQLYVEAARAMFPENVVLGRLIYA